ncbi:hypothetical protein NI17_017465 [Thermobifida halotolerans]|uniref:Uncharacterized protein n=1 Tax=Thermobifida halotolerans TaxID=483545 RepID=A0A399G135_9ACTN|nr:hypothetical protein [Thermobifida halotolerans]UOE18590.1 hypothetical protein NI17_017465 [Thermobifida halotolerans]
MSDEEDVVLDPGKIVIPAADPDAIEAAGKALKGDAGDISQAGHDIKASWAGLEGHYIAPESEELLAAVDPVADDGDDMDDRITTVGQALIDFAEEIRPLLAKWKSLKSDAETMAAEIAELGEEWNDDEDRVEAHRVLNNDLAAVQTDYQAAERECANAITALVEGGTRFVAAELDGSTVPDDGEMVYGLAEAPEGMATEWATPQEHDAPWWVDVGAAIGDFVVGEAQDLAAQFGFYHDERGWGADSWSEWRANLKDHWGQTLTTPAYLLGLYNGENVVGSVEEWRTNMASTWSGVVHSVVPWTEWGDRPGYVVTTTALNLGSIALDAAAVAGGTALSVTGYGAVVGVPLAAWRGASLLSKLGRFSDAVPDMSSSSTPGLDASVTDRPNLPDGFNLPDGRTPGDITTDLGDALDDSLSIPSSHTDALNDALANAENFGHPPSGNGHSPGGNPAPPPADSTPHTPPPGNTDPAPSPSTDTDASPSSPAEDAPHSDGEQSSHPAGDTSADADGTPEADAPASTAPDTDRSGAGEEASASGGPADRTADSDADIHASESSERLATTGQMEWTLNMLDSYVDTPEDLITLIDTGRDTQADADVSERDLVTANAHHDTPNTRPSGGMGDGSGGPADLPGSGGGDRGSGVNLSGGGDGGSAGGRDGSGGFNGNDNRPSGNGHSGSGGNDVPDLGHREPWDSRADNGNGDDSHTDRDGQHDADSDGPDLRNEHEESGDQGGGQNTGEGSPEGDGPAGEEPLTPEQEKLLRRADGLEEKLREGGLTDEEIAQLRGSYPRDSHPWQRLFGAMRLKDTPNGDIVLGGINKKAFNILHPEATRFAFDLASGPKEFSYLYEYYIANFEENRRLIGEDVGLAERFQKSQKSKVQFAAENVVASDVESSLRSDLEVIREVRGETTAIDPDLPADGLEQAIRENAGKIGMGHEFSAAYHALKHHHEIPPQEMVGNRVRYYLGSAERTIREGELSLMETQEDGRIKLEFTRTETWHDGTREKVSHLRALIFVGWDGSVIMATYGGISR